MKAVSGVYTGGIISVIYLTWYTGWYIRRKIYDKYPNSMWIDTHGWTAWKLLLQFVHHDISLAMYGIFP